MFVNDTKSKGIEKSRLKKFREHMFDRGKMEGDITVSGFDLSLLDDELSILPPGSISFLGMPNIFYAWSYKRGLHFCDDDFQTGVRKYSLMNSFLLCRISYVRSIKKSFLWKEKNYNAVWFYCHFNFNWRIWYRTIFTRSLKKKFRFVNSNNCYWILYTKFSKKNSIICY